MTAASEVTNLAAGIGRWPWIVKESSERIHFPIHLFYRSVAGITSERVTPCGPGSDPSPSEKRAERE
jgi:hypothetical protein